MPACDPPQLDRFDWERCKSYLESNRCQQIRCARRCRRLRGGRGDAALDVAAFCRAAVAVAELARTGRVVTVDVNPVMLGRDWEGCAAADAVVTVSGRTVQDRGIDQC